MAKTRYLGDGLAKSLDARRLKSFLKLDDSQWRAIAEELDRLAPRGWRSVRHSTEFYEGLLDLVWSAQGRLAYVEAAKALRAADKVRKRKQNIGLLLAADCVKKTARKSKSLESFDDERVLSECETRLAKDGRWNRLAELVWARSLHDGTGDRVQRAIDEHPELAKELGPVIDGLTEHPVGEDDPVNRVKTLAGQLDGLALAPIAELHAATEELLRIAQRDGVKRDAPGVPPIEPKPDREPISPADLAEEWHEAMSLCEEPFAPLVGRIGCAELPLPEIGYELRTKRGEVIGEAEIAWPEEEVAIIAESDQDDRQPFESAGWRVLDDTVDVAVIAGALESACTRLWMAPAEP